MPETIDVSKVWTAPGLDKERDDAFAGLVSRAQQASRGNLQTVDIPIKQRTKDAAEKSASSAIAAEKVVAEELAKQQAISGERMENISREARLKKTALEAEFARDDALTEINRRSLAEYNEAIAQQSNRLGNVSTQRMAIDDKINANKAIGLLDDPLSWLAAQFENAGLIGQRNSLATTENSLQNSVQGLQTAARNAAELEKSTLPVRTSEEKAAGYELLQTAAQEKLLDERQRLSGISNTAAVTLSNLTAHEAQTLFNMDNAEYQRQVAKINSINENTKFQTGAPLRELELMRANGDRGALLIFKEFERMTGLREGTGANIIKTLDNKTQGLVIQAAISGEIRDPETARVIAHIANTSGQFGGNPMPSNIRELVEMQLNAEAEFNKQLYSEGGVKTIDARGKVVTMKASEFETKQDVEKSVTRQKFIVQNLQKQVMEKALAISPKALAFSDPTFVQRFPVLKALIDSPEQVTEDSIIENLTAANNGNLSKTAEAYAALNRERNDAAALTTATKRAGFPMPEKMIVDGVIAAPMGNTQKYRFNAMDSADVERYLRTRELMMRRDDRGRHIRGVYISGDLTAPKPAEEAKK